MNESWGQVIAKARSNAELERGGTRRLVVKPPGSLEEVTLLFPGCSVIHMYCSTAGGNN